MKFSQLIVACFVGFLAMPANANNHLDEFEDPVVGLAEGLDVCLSSAVNSNQSAYNCIGYSADNCLTYPENQTTVGMELCNLDEMRAWDVLLNRYYQVLRADGSFAGLRDIQRAWISYRDLKCDLYDEVYQGGSIVRVLRADCMRQETARRVLDLYLFVSEVDGR